MRLRFAVFLAFSTLAAVPATASASEIIDRNANDVSLKVAQNGQALVSYNARGKRWNVLAWGAINALHPTPGRKQVEFKLDYSGGYGTYKRDVWKTFKDACRPTTAPTCSGSSPAARPPTAPTGRSSPGSGCCRTTASRRRRSSRSGSCGSRTSAARCRC